MIDSRFAYAFFSLLWHNDFLIALGQCIIAGAAGTWFFAPNNEKISTPKVCKAVWNALFWHPGSLAFGALILAIVQFLKWWMYYLSQQAKAQKNRVAVLIFKLLGNLLACFERCIKFLNKNAYIQIALRGTNFCTSAKNAFTLILENWVRFGVLAMLGSCIRFVGCCFILIMTGVTGYFLLQHMYPEVSPIASVLLYLVVGYLAAMLTMNVFGLAMDTALQCLIISEEKHYRGDFVPAPLSDFIKTRDLQGEDAHHDSCFSCDLCGCNLCCEFAWCF